MSNRSVCSIAIFLCCASIYGAARNPFYRESAPQTEEELPAEECELGPRSMRLGIRHIENKGVGYNTGYTTFETFLAPPSGMWAAMPFLDLRGHVFDDGRWAANGGIGLRKLKRGRVYGGYAYYDYRNTSHKNDYNQISFGFETLGNLWDMRLNGYVPFGSTKSLGYDLAFGQFVGNTLFVTRKFEYSLAGANGEIGFHAVRKGNFDLYTALGPYYLKGTSGGAIWGGEARLRAGYRDYVGVEVNYSYDSTFKNIVQGQLFFNIPFGPRSKVYKNDSATCAAAVMLAERMVQPVVKNEIIPVNQEEVESAAINPLTGEPYTFWFVDNTSHSAGTYESPFPTLLDAQNASGVSDIIYVFPGDLTTTGMDAGIQLQDYQKLWGTGIPHTLNTTFGSITIPAISTGAFQNPFPSISIARVPIITSATNPSDVIGVANNNEISGLYIQNVYGSGITPQNVPIVNLTVTHNIIQGPDTSDVPGAYGISLQSTEGTVLIDSNMIFQGNIGINIESTSVQNATYIISNNSCPALGAAGGGSAPYGNFLVTSYTDCANISTVISGNAFSVSNYSVQMTFDNATAQQACSVDISNNTINSDSANSGTSLSFTLSNDANVNLSAMNNQLNTPYANGITVSQSNNSQMNVQIAGNSFSTWNSSLSFTLGNSSQLTGAIYNNDFIFDEDSGILIVANSSSTVSNFSVTNNLIQGVLQSYSTGSDSISITTNTDAVAAVTIAMNTIQGGSNGLALVTNNSSSMTASVTGNICTNVQLYGLSFTTNNSSTGTWNLDQNTIVAVGAGSALITDTGSVLATSNGTSTTNLSFTNNLSSPIQLSISETGSYQFTNNSATFKLTSYSGNTGVLTKTGVITN